MLQKSSKFTLMLTAAEVAVFASVGLMASRVYTLGEAWSIALAFAVAYLGAKVLLWRTHRATPATRVVLLALALFMSCCALRYFVIWTSVDDWDRPCTLSYPGITGDDSYYFHWAVHYYDGSCPVPEKMAFKGFPSLVWCLFKLFGVSCVWPVAMNMMFTMMAIVLMGMVTVRLLRHRVRGVSESSLQLCGMVGVMMLMFYLSQGMMIQKEATVYLLIALAAWVFAGLNDPLASRSRTQKKILVRDLALMVVSCVGFAFVRTTYLYFIFIGIVCMAVAHRGRHWRFCAALAAICLACFVLGNYFAYYSVARHVSIVRGGDVMQNLYLIEPSQQPYLRMIGDYFSFSYLHRLALLPMTSAVQFVIPFPWVYKPFFINELARLAWGWYAVGGIALFYYLFIAWRRRSGTLGAWAWWPVLCFLAIAYVMAGSVNRYVLPIEQLFVPVAVYVLHLLRYRRYRRAMMWWSIAYVVVLGSALIVCHRIQTNYLRALSEHYSRIRAAKGL